MPSFILTKIQLFKTFNHFALGIKFSFSIIVINFVLSDQLSIILIVYTLIRFEQQNFLVDFI